MSLENESLNIFTSLDEEIRKKDNQVIELAKRLRQREFEPYLYSDEKVSEWKTIIEDDSRLQKTNTDTFNINPNSQMNKYPTILTTYDFHKYFDPMSMHSGITLTKFMKELNIDLEFKLLEQLSEIVVVAGGNILYYLNEEIINDETKHKTMKENLIVDFYSLDNDIEQKTHNIYHILSNIANDNVIVMRTKYYVLFFTHGKIYRLCLQPYYSINHITSSQSIDCECIALYKKELYIHPRFERAYETLSNLVDTTKLATYYERDLIRYAAKGISVSVPGFDASRINYERLNNLEKRQIVSNSYGLSLLMHLSYNKTFYVAETEEIINYNPLNSKTSNFIDNNKTDYIFNAYRKFTKNIVTKEYSEVSGSTNIYDGHLINWNHNHIKNIYACLSQNKSANLKVIVRYQNSNIFELTEEEEKFFSNDTYLTSILEDDRYIDAPWYAEAYATEDEMTEELKQRLDKVKEQREGMKELFKVLNFITVEFDEEDFESFSDDDDYHSYEEEEEGYHSPVAAEMIERPPPINRNSVQSPRRQNRRAIRFAIPDDVEEDEPSSNRNLGNMFNEESDDDSDINVILNRLDDPESSDEEKEEQENELDRSDVNLWLYFLRMKQSGVFNDNDILEIHSRLFEYDPVTLVRIPSVDTLLTEISYNHNDDDKRERFRDILKDFVRRDEERLQPGLPDVHEDVQEGGNDEVFLTLDPNNKEKTTIKYGEYKDIKSILREILYPLPDITGISDNVLRETFNYVLLYQDGWHEESKKEIHNGFMNYLNAYDYKFDGRNHVDKHDAKYLSLLVYFVRYKNIPRRYYFAFRNNYLELIFPDGFSLENMFMISQVYDQMADNINETFGKKVIQTRLNEKIPLSIYITNIKTWLISRNSNGDPNFYKLELTTKENLFEVYKKNITNMENKPLSIEFTDNPSEDAGGVIRDFYTLLSVQLNDEYFTENGFIKDGSENDNKIQYVSNLIYRSLKEDAFRDVSVSFKIFPLIWIYILYPNTQKFKTMIEFGDFLSNKTVSNLSEIFRMLPFLIMDRFHYIKDLSDISEEEIKKGKQDPEYKDNRVKLCGLMKESHRILEYDLGMVDKGIIFSELSLFKRVTESFMNDNGIQPESILSANRLMELYQIYNNVLQGLRSPYLQINGIAKNVFYDLDTQTYINSNNLSVINTKKDKKYDSELFLKVQDIEYVNGNVIEKGNPNKVFKLSNYNLSNQYINIIQRDMNISMKQRMLATLYRPDNMKGIEKGDFIDVNAVIQYYNSKILNKDVFIEFKDTFSTIYEKDKSIYEKLLPRLGSIDFVDFIDLTSGTDYDMEHVLSESKFTGFSSDGINVLKEIFMELSKGKFIEETDEDKQNKEIIGSGANFRKHFMQLMTGNSKYKQGIELSFIINNGIQGYLAFHSCFNNVEINMRAFMETGDFKNFKRQIQKEVAETMISTKKGKIEYTMQGGENPVSLSN